MPTGLVAGARVEPAAVASPDQRAARDRAKRRRFRWILAACVGGALVVIAAAWAAASWVDAGG